MEKQLAKSIKKTKSCEEEKVAQQATIEMHSLDECERELFAQMHENESTDVGSFKTSSHVKAVITDKAN